MNDTEKQQQNQQNIIAICRCFHWRVWSAQAIILVPLDPILKSIEVQNIAFWNNLLEWSGNM